MLCCVLFFIFIIIILVIFFFLKNDELIIRRLILRCSLTLVHINDVLWLFDDAFFNSKYYIFLLFQCLTSYEYIAMTSWLEHKASKTKKPKYFIINIYNTKGICKWVVINIVGLSPWSLCVHKSWKITNEQNIGWDKKKTGSAWDLKCCQEHHSTSHRPQKIWKNSPNDNFQYVLYIFIYLSCCERICFSSLLLVMLWQFTQLIIRTPKMFKELFFLK